jgi:hypothetical protein
MVKMKKSKNKSTPVVQQALGSMSASSRAANVRATTLITTVVSTARSFTLSQIQPGNSIFSTGHFLQLSTSGSLGDLYPSGLPNILANYDMFRFKKVEFFCSVAPMDGETVFPNVVVLASVDLDDAIPISWDTFRTRRNISMITLNSADPLRLIAAWSPVGNYAVSTQTSTPANQVPSHLQWFDCSALEQQFLGLKIHIATTSDIAPVVSFFVKAEIELKGQV